MRYESTSAAILMRPGYNGGMDRHALLAIDTSTEICSVAVCFPLPTGEHAFAPTTQALSTIGREVRATPATEPIDVTEASVYDDHAAGLRFITIERLTGSVSSGFILPAIDAVLSAAGMSLPECGALAFGAGPGSFTGLRTATGVAQGLAFGANLKVLPVNTLMACAESARQRGKLADCTHVLAVMDARMSQCYWEVFDGLATDGSWRSLAPSAVSDPSAIVVPVVGNEERSPADTLSSLALSQKYAVVGNGANVYGDQLRVIETAYCVDTDARPGATAIAAVAWRDWLAGRAVAPAEALPRYVRDKVASTTMEREVERAERAEQAERAAVAKRAALAAVVQEGKS